MNSKIKLFLKLIPNQENGNNNIPNIIQQVLIGLFFGIIPLIIFSALTQGYVYKILSVYEIVVIILFGLNKRGYYKLASFLFSLSIILLATIFMLLAEEGSHDIVIIIFPAMVVIAGLVMERGYYYALFTLNIIILDLFMILELNGIIVNKMSNYTSIQNIISATLILFIASFATDKIVSNLRNKIKTLRIKQQELYENELRLENQTRISQESELRYRSLIEHAVDAIFILDNNGNILEINQKSCELTGYNKEELLSMHVSGIFLKEELIKSPLRYELLNESKSITIERYITTKTRETVPVEMSSKLLPNRTIQSFFRDISERKKSEESHRETERRFFAFLNSTEDIAFLKDQQGKYLFVNYRMAELYDKNEDEIIGKTDFDLIPRKDAQRYFEYDQKVLKNKEFVIYEETINDKHFETRKFHIHLKGDEIGVGGFVRDITKNKKLEKQIIQTEKMSVIGQLAGGIAHDLNNILTALIGNTQIIEMKIDPETKIIIGRNLDSLNNSYFRAKEIVSQILTFSRQQPVTKCDMELNGLIKDSVKMLSRLIPENIRLEKNISNLDLLISADPSQLEQIIMNLIINSRDAISGGGVIEIRTEPVDIQYDIITKNGIMKSGKYALLILKDNGSGIPGKIIDKIFDPFFTTKEVGKGTGLGLSIVINNVTKNNAYLNLYSENNKGTEFKIYFPLIEKLKEHITDTKLGNIFLGSGENILVVEDDESIRFLLVEYLNNMNYTLCSAKNGFEALNICEKEDIDLILTDITMPEMGGKELLYSLQKRNINIPVVAMSGYYQHSEIVNSGFYEILNKPLDLSKVSELFHKIFRNNRKIKILS